MKRHRINNEITESEVRLIGGVIVSIKEALKMASEQSLDLVEINQKTSPIICQIVDYKKFVYEEKKKQKDNVKKQKTKDVKEIKIKPNINDNDLSIKKKKIIEFLEEGHKVKITLSLSGRERFIDYTITKGELLLLNISEETSEIAKTDNLPKLTGSTMTITLTPKKNDK